jgi:hypothetical protein
MDLADWLAFQRFSREQLMKRLHIPPDDQDDLSYDIE